MSPENGTLGGARPPGSLTEAARRWVHETVASRLPARLQSIIRATREPFIQPVVDYDPENIVEGRVVLIGDAASPSRPADANGLNKGVEDAITLVEHLVNSRRSWPGFFEALAAWAAKRLPFAKKAGRHANDPHETSKAYPDFDTPPPDVLEDPDASRAHEQRGRDDGRDGGDRGNGEDEQRGRERDDGRERGERDRQRGDGGRDDGGDPGDPPGGGGNDSPDRTRRSRLSPRGTVLAAIGFLDLAGRGRRLTQAQLNNIRDSALYIGDQDQAIADLLTNDRDLRERFSNAVRGAGVGYRQQLRDVAEATSNVVDTAIGRWQGHSQGW